MKIAISFTDETRGIAEKIVEALRIIIPGRLKVKETAPKDGFYHLYIKTFLAQKEP